MNSIVPTILGVIEGHTKLTRLTFLCYAQAHEQSNEATLILCKAAVCRRKLEEKNSRQSGEDYPPPLLYRNLPLLKAMQQHLYRPFSFMPQTKRKPGLRKQKMRQSLSSSLVISAKH